MDKLVEERKTEDHFTRPPRPQFQRNTYQTESNKLMSTSTGGNSDTSSSTTSSSPARLAMLREKYRSHRQKSAVVSQVLTQSMEVNANTISELDSRSSCSDESSNSTVVEMILNEDKKLKSVLKVMPLPFWSNFEAHLLGISIDGKVVIQVENDKINDEYRKLKHDLKKFYSSNNVENERPVSYASLEPGYLVCFEKSGTIIRAKVVHVDHRLGFCTLMDVDKYETHSVDLKNLFELDARFNTPAKAVECILDGMKVIPLSTKTYAAISACLRTLSPKVKATVIQKTKGVDSFPVVSLTTETKKDVASILLQKLSANHNVRNSTELTAQNNEKEKKSVQKCEEAEKSKENNKENASEFDLKAGSGNGSVDQSKEANAMVQTQSMPPNFTKPVSVNDPSLKVTQFGNRSKENQMSFSAPKNSYNINRKGFYDGNRSSASANFNPHIDRHSSFENRNKNTSPFSWRQEEPTIKQTQYANGYKKKPATGLNNTSRNSGSLEWDNYVDEIIGNLNRLSPQKMPALPVAGRGNRVKALIITEVETEYFLCPYFPDRNLASTMLTPAGITSEQTNNKMTTSDQLHVSLMEKNATGMAMLPRKNKTSSVPETTAQNVFAVATHEMSKGFVAPTANAKPLKNGNIPPPLEIKTEQPCISPVAWKSNSTVFPVALKTTSSFDSGLLQMDLPPASDFSAKILGTDSYGYFIIQICESTLDAEFEILHESLQDFYSSRQSRAIYRLSPSELKSGMIVVANVEEEFIRCKVYDVDVNLGISTLVGLEGHEFYDVDLKDIYRIDDIFKSLPQRAVKCMLSGLELHMLTAEIPEVFAITNLGSTKVRVRVDGNRNSIYLVPTVTMTLANGDDLAELIKKNGCEILKRVQTVDEIHERLALQMQLRCTLLHNHYLTNSG